MAQGQDFIKVEEVGRVVHITIDHPPMNTISAEILQQLAKVCYGSTWDRRASLQAKPDEVRYDHHR